MDECFLVRKGDIFSRREGGESWSQSDGAGRGDEDNIGFG